VPKQLAFLMFACFFLHDVKCQATRDSVYYGSTEKIIGLYYMTLGEQAPIYNGNEYIEYAYTLQEGHPFYKSSVFTSGDIYFDGMVFLGVPMLYDLIKDQVVIRDFYNQYKINLPANKIQQFILSDHVFVRIVRNSFNEMNTGFYEQLYKGKTGLFVKRGKEIIEKRGSNAIDNVVISTNGYYVVKKDVYYKFKNERSLLKILDDKKKEIQQYLKKNRVRYKDDPERAMIMAIEYYNRSMD
jgi:hypothetical protein